MVKVTGAIIGVLVILGAVFLLIQKSEKEPLEKANKESGTEVTEERVSAVTGDVLTTSGEADLPLTYQNQQFGFELNLPGGYTGSSFIEGNGVTVLFQNTATSESFQIYIMPFDETKSITVSRIQEDVPGLTIENPQNALIAGGTIETLIFIGESEEFGTTREVWFVQDGYLYQVIAPFAMEQTIGAVVETLRFE